MHFHITGRLNVVLRNSHFEQRPNFEYFCPSEGALTLDGYFGVPNLGVIFEFCEAVERRLNSTDNQLALLISHERNQCSNSIFLLGAYIIMLLEKDLEPTILSLEPILSNSFHAWNISDHKTSNPLCLRGCLGALHRAKRIGWINFGQGPNRFDIDEYRQLGSLLNADLHEVIPGKLIMMRGPRDLPGGAIWRDLLTDNGRLGSRDFSPAHYVDILAQMDVQAVVRCSAPAYDQKCFEKAGIAVVDLCYEDDAPPPIDVVSKFLTVVELLPRAVAVHCGSGRGRSGTLVALYIMKHHGFAAREAMGWLRMVRPGW